MKKNLLLLAMLASAAGANAYWLPTPVITSETKEDGKVNITWDYDTEHEDAKFSHFVLTVYKMHKAAAAERFVLASTDFDYIESKGTMTDSEERMAVWDEIETCPGWWARFPKYMDKAMGVSTYQNFTGGAHLDDPFSGSYILSPDYDLSHVTDKKLNVSASIAREADSVEGGFVVYAWNTNWWDPNNVDYKPVYDLTKIYDDLGKSSWKDKSEELWFPNPDDYTDDEQIAEVLGIDHTRTRVSFYGNGYSTYWVNNFEVSVDLKAGDMVDYGASSIRLDNAARTYSIDTTGDTENDYVYAYDIRAVSEEFEDYCGMDVVCAINNPYKKAKYVIGDFAGVECIGDAADTEVSVIASNGYISVAGAQDMEVYNASGACVYSGSADRQVNVGKGVFIVKAGSKTEKVIM